MTKLLIKGKENFKKISVDLVGKHHKWETFCRGFARDWSLFEAIEESLSGTGMKMKKMEAGRAV